MTAAGGKGEDVGSLVASGRAGRGEAGGGGSAFDPAVGSKKKCVFSLRFAESLRQVFFTYFCLFIFFFLFQISFPGPPAMWE